MKLPEQHVTVLALLNFDDVPPIPAVGFIAETTDTKTPYFHVPLFGGKGYDVSLIAKWKYLDEIAPDYCIPGGHKIDPSSHQADAELRQLLQKQAEENTKLLKRNAEYRAFVESMLALMEDSDGVAGYHLNGTMATWDELYLISDAEKLLKGESHG